MSDIAWITPDEIADLTSPEKIALAIDLVKPHLEADRRTLVYLLPQSGRIGQFSVETYYLYEVFGEAFDEILVVVNSSARFGLNRGVRRIAQQYMRIIEAPNPDLMRMGLFDGPVQEYGSATLGLYSAKRLIHDAYQARRSGQAPAIMTLPEEMRREARYFLKRLGVPEDAPIVTVHARDQSYMPNLTYHAHRNTSFQNYTPAIRELIRRGFWVIRLGDATTPPTFGMPPGFIDLPHAPGYNDSLDAALIARSHFSICCDSGPEGLCRMLGIPALMVNCQVFPTHILKPSDVLMFKSYIEISSGRALSYPEIIERNLWSGATANYFAERDIQVEENTPEDLTAATLEMIARLEGTFEVSAEIDTRFRKIGQDLEANVLPHMPLEDLHDISPYSRMFSFAGDWNNICQSYCDAHPEYLGTT